MWRTHGKTRRRFHKQFIDTPEKGCSSLTIQTIYMKDGLMIRSNLTGLKSSSVSSSGQSSTAAGINRLPDSFLWCLSLGWLATAGSALCFQGRGRGLFIWGEPQGGSSSSFSKAIRGEKFGSPDKQARVLSVSIKYDESNWKEICVHNA